MTREEFAEKIDVLLPGHSTAALDGWAELAKDLDDGAVAGRSETFDELYAALSVIRGQHGEEMASRIYDMGERFALNPFELTTAARLLSEGMTPEEAHGDITHHGANPTPEEAKAFHAAVWELRGGAASGMEMQM